MSVKGQGQRNWQRPEHTECGRILNVFSKDLNVVPKCLICIHIIHYIHIHKLSFTYTSMWKVEGIRPSVDQEKMVHFLNKSSFSGSYFGIL